MSKRKRSNPSSNPLPNDVIASLEQADRKAAKLRKSNLSTETLPKSYAAKSQMQIQTNLMECRILMQRALTSISTVNNDDDTANANAIQNALDQLSSKLIKARKQLCSSTLFYDSDNDSESEDNNTSNQDYNKLCEFWKKTLNKHYANLSLQNQQNKNKFQVVDMSFWSQVEANVKHSQLIQDSMHGDESNLSFDDSKLYQHLLQEYISLSTERGGTENIANLAAERLKRSMKKTSHKKDVDGRASKGRKIRYIVHDKLQNFTFPMQRPIAVMGEDVLFKSMLGGVVAKR
jgi:putative sterol carrier protein